MIARHSHLPMPHRLRSLLHYSNEVCTRIPHVPTVTYDRYSLKLDEKRVIIRAGAMHYFRLPGLALRRDRLRKLKAAGYNAVDLYIPWSFHAPAPGTFNFEGCRDLDALLKLTQELGLWVIIRPGPYINAELSGGGLPGWLLARDDITIRCIDEHHHHNWSEGYLKEVEAWWSVLFPKFVDAPNLILVQIENEYVTEDLDPAYMQWLYDLARRLGVRVPLFHNDLYTFGCYGDIVDLYAFDHYPTRELEPAWHDDPETMLAVVDHTEEAIRPYCENRPLFIAEFQSGWFSPWKIPTAQALSKQLDRAHLRLLTKSAVAQGVTIFNHYMAIGGTNWAHLGSTDTQSSYDFVAPISETGDLTPPYYEAKAFNQFLKHFPVKALDTVRPESIGLRVSEESLLYKVLKATDENYAGTHWIILRNLKKEAVTCKLNLEGLGQFEVTIPALDAVWLPYKLRLESGHTVLFSTNELLAQQARSLLVKATVPGSIMVSTGDDSALQTIQIKPSEPAQAIAGLWHGLSLIALGQRLIDTAWLINSRQREWVFGPDQPPLNKVEAATTNSVDAIYSLNTFGKLEKRQAEKESAPDLTLPMLSDWQLRAADPTTLTALPGEFKPVTQAMKQRNTLGQIRFNRWDLDALGLYEGAAWYLVPLEELPEKITLQARHVWAVYLNRQLVGQGWFLKDDPTEPTPPEVELSLPPEAWLEGDTPNYLWLWVDSLGHPKGFFHDAKEPGGLLSLTLDGKSVEASRLHVAGALELSLPPEPDAVTVPNFCLAKATFTLNTAADELIAANATLGLALEGECPWTRVDMYCNGELFARYWNEGSTQRRFVIPAPFLQLGQNTVSLAISHPAEAHPAKVDFLRGLADTISLQWLSVPVTPLRLS